MNERPDLSALTDKQVYEISGVLWDLNACLCMLIEMGVLPEEEPLDLPQLQGYINDEAKMRVAMRRAVVRAGRDGS